MAQSYLTLCNPTDCSPPGSSVHEILHTRILELDAMAGSNYTPMLKKNGGMLVTLEAEKLLVTLTMQRHHLKPAGTRSSPRVARPEAPRPAGRGGTGPPPSLGGPQAPKHPERTRLPVLGLQPRDGPAHLRTSSTERPQVLKVEGERWTLSDAPQLLPRGQATGLASSPRAQSAGERAGHTGQLPAQPAGT